MEGAGSRAGACVPRHCLVCRIGQLGKLGVRLQSQQGKAAVPAHSERSRAELARSVDEMIGERLIDV